MNTKISGKPRGKGTVRELAGRVFRGVLRDNCDGYAAQIAFFFLFALFPFLLSLTTLLAYLPVSDLIRVLLKILGHFVPGDVLSLVEKNLRALAGVHQGGLLSFGVLLSLWTSSNAVIAVRTALNNAYDSEEQRPWWKVRAIAVLLVICFTFFVIASLMLLIFGHRIGVWIASLAGLGIAFTTVWNILRWPVIVWLMMSALSALYRYAPTMKLQWWETVPGAITAAGAWIAVSLAFSYFVNSYGSYDKTYGSIGAVIALLVWMYASGLVILIGGEINARWSELCCEKQAALLTKGAGQMRKTLITTEIQKDIHPELNWLDLVTIARVELSSEDPAHPIESALISSGGSGWRAMEPGMQTIRLLFDEPLDIKRIHLMFHEDEQQRTQEFVLRWSPDNGRSYREIVRQQYNFTHSVTTRETEDFTVDLAGVTTLELSITPDISGGEVRASLAKLRLA